MEKQCWDAPTYCTRIRSTQEPNKAQNTFPDITIKYRSVRWHVLHICLHSNELNRNHSELFRISDHCYTSMWGCICDKHRSNSFPLCCLEKTSGKRHVTQTEFENSGMFQLSVCTFPLLYPTPYSIQLAILSCTLYILIQLIRVVSHTHTSDGGPTI